MIAAREVTVKEKQVLYFVQEQMSHSQEDLDFILECIDAKINNS